VPDGTSGGPTQPPADPGDQIQAEINSGVWGSILSGLFGAGGAPKTGGGQGGTFMFASLAELDAVIAQWQAEYQEITEDGQVMQQIAGFLRRPADDPMSDGHVSSAQKSFIEMVTHNEAMRAYAEDYIRKLQESRTSIANNNLNGQARMDSMNRG